MNSSITTSNLGYKKPDLLERYPDIDYEMIPIKEEVLVRQSKQFHIEQLPPFGMKNMLKQARQFKLVSKSISKPSSGPILHITNKMNADSLVVSQKIDLTVLIPLRQIVECKKTKKHTKIYLMEGQIIKTAINFKKIEQCLLENGFIKQKKSHLVSTNTGFHFPNASSNK